MTGGFQIGKGKWEGDWRAGSGDPKTQKKREQVPKWMDAYMDYGMILDIPHGFHPEGAKASNTQLLQEAVEGTNRITNTLLKTEQVTVSFQMFW